MGYSEYALHLWSMMSGQPHPAAENPILSCPRTVETEPEIEIYSVSITNSRLAILVAGSQSRDGAKMIVWDWRTGKILLVSGPLPRQQS